MLDRIADAFLARGDLAHLALLLWALLASALAGRLLLEFAAAARRFDAFVQELARFNRRHAGEGALSPPRKGQGSAQPH